MDFSATIATDTVMQQTLATQKSVIKMTTANKVLQLHLNVKQRLTTTINKKLSHRLENRASATRTSFHHNATLKNLAFYLGVFYSLQCKSAFTCFHIVASKSKAEKSSQTDDESRF